SPPRLARSSSTISVSSTARAPGATKAWGSVSASCDDTPRCSRGRSAWTARPAKAPPSSWTCPVRGGHATPCRGGSERRYRRSGGARRLIEQEPVETELGHRAHELFEVHRLDDVAVDPEFVALDDVALLARRGHHHHRDAFRARIGLDPPQDLEPVHLG